MEAALAPHAAHLNLLVGRRMSPRFNMLLLSPPVPTKTCCLDVFKNDRHELTAKTTVSPFFSLRDEHVWRSPTMSRNSDALTFPSAWKASAVSEPVRKLCKSLVDRNAR